MSIFDSHKDVRKLKKIFLCLSHRYYTRKYCLSRLSTSTNGILICLRIPNEPVCECLAYIVRLAIFSKTESEVRDLRDESSV